MGVKKLKVTTKMGRKEYWLKTSKMEMHGLTDDIVFEIMVWLSANSLMRFRCVSKAWNTMIRCDPAFIKSHIARSQSRPSATHLLLELEIRLKYHWPRSPEGPSLRLVPHNYFDPREIIICSNHCNGLVCLHSYKDTQNYLYNVTTGEMKAFPFSLSCQHDNRGPELFLGFDSATERYKLLHYCRHCPIGTEQMKILTLGTNSWRGVGYANDFDPTEPVFLNGVIYWIIDDRIEYFNFTNENFGTLFPQRGHLESMNEMQTALLGKLVMHYSNFYPHEEGNLVYDDVYKVIRKLNSSTHSVKVPLLEVEGIDNTKDACVVLATTSIEKIVPTSLEIPYYYPLSHVSSFVENIIPLTFIIDV